MNSGNKRADERAFWMRGIIAAAVALSLGACASTRPEAAEGYGADTVNDPLEPVNRAVFKFNDAVDTVIIRPVATVYDEVVPSPVQQGVTNFLTNLRMPIVFANQLLQGDWTGAEVAGTRFFLNTTLGLGGFIDIAAYKDLQYEPEDFGQTLGVWGVGEGPYLVLPILGPSNPRDALGFVVDAAADPVRSVAGEDFTYGRTGATIVDQRQQTLTTTDDLKRSSIDYYATVRSLYRQYRQAQILDGEAGAMDVPDIPDFEAMPDFGEAPPTASPPVVEQTSALPQPGTSGAPASALDRLSAK
ncbi:MAG TPA: VacJ family lipoprotein [Alphaproteobacteria bacterium]|nr:VacJ family lipoprotein [Alphaproteobacteria bacterium]